MVLHCHTSRVRSLDMYARGALHATASQIDQWYRSRMEGYFFIPSGLVVRKADTLQMGQPS